MATEQATRACCQSCGMPLDRTDDRGTARDGLRINDYCHSCFENGAFVEPDLTAPRMIDQCSAIMARQGIMPEAQARVLMAGIIPTLKRW